MRPRLAIRTRVVLAVVMGAMVGGVCADHGLAVARTSVGPGLTSDSAKNMNGQTVASSSKMLTPAKEEREKTQDLTLELIRRSRSGDTYECAGANTELGKIDSKLAVDALINNLRANYWQAPDAAAVALGRKKDPRVFDALVAALDYPSRDYQWCRSLHAGVAEALGDLGDRRAIDPLSKLLQKKGEDTWTICCAIRAIEKLKGREAADALIKCLTIRDWYVRVAAAEALGRFNDPRGLAAARTTMLIRHGDVDALTEMGEPITDDLMVMMASLHLVQGYHEAERNTVTKVFARLGRPGATHLLEALKDKKEDARARFNAASVLGEIGDTKSEMMVSALVDALQDRTNYSGNGYFDTRRYLCFEAAKALNRLGDKRGMEFVLGIFNTIDAASYVSGAFCTGAVYYLGEMGTEQEIVQLKALMERPGVAEAWKYDCKDAIGRIEMRISKANKPTSR